MKPFAFLVTTLIISFFGYIAKAQINLPPNFYYVQVGGTGTTINSPTTMAFLPDGRVFVADQSGKLRVFKNDVLLATPFITLAVDAAGERGLIGVAVDPDYSTNGYVYLYYTIKGAGTNPSHNRLSRFTADMVNKDIVDSKVAETILLELPNLSTATNHNGGCLGFGRDGKLYIAVGDNAHGSDRIQQDTTSYFGKILRINKDGSCPTDNPFYSVTHPDNVASHLWAFGLRNPYTFSIDPVTGKLFLNEVGQNTWEEIDDASTGGRNFGWPDYEGMSTDPKKLFNYQNPTYTYNHSSKVTTPSGCAITGGTFFTSTTTNYPAQYNGKYFFQDFCSGWIYYFDPLQSNPIVAKFADGLGANTLSMNVSPDGKLYYLNRTNKTLNRIEYDPKFSILQSPQAQSVHQGDNISFQVITSGTGTLTYQWQKNGVAIANNNLATLSIPNVQLADSGNYRVVVTNFEGSSLISQEAKLTVLPTNSKPIATILSPIKSPQQYYKAGDLITLNGTGTDKEDGTLPASAFEWHIDFHHNTHKHDQPPIVGQQTLKVTIPDEGETSDNVWYRFILMVKDSQGQLGVDSVDVYPLKATITLSSIPTGMQLALDGEPFIADTSFLSVQGLKRSFTAPTQIKNGNTYKFISWSNSTDSTQTIATPTANTTYVATFKKEQSISFDTIQTKTYGIASFTLNATATSGLPVTYSSSDNSIASINGSQVTIIKAGQCTITASQAGDNLNLPASPVTQNLKINRAQLTITADNQSKYFSDANPKLSYKFKGFVNNEDTTVLTNPVVINTSATANSSTGTYPINVSGAAALNYAITFVPGTLTINPAPAPTITLIDIITASTGNTIHLTGTYFLGATAINFGGTSASSFTINSASSITAVVGNGASGSITVTTPSGTGTFAGFNFVPIPTLSASGPTTILSDGVGVTLTANPSSGGYTYQWQNNGVNISGATKASYTTTQSGNYAVIITLNNVSQTSAATTVTAVFNLTANNYHLTVTGETCNGSSNGTVAVTADASLNYTAVLSGNGISTTTQKFSSTTTFNNLPAGTYTLTFTVDGQTSYSKAYTVTVTQPKPLSVFATVNEAAGNIELNLSGGSVYHIQLNNKTYTTTESSFSVPIEHGNNALQVTTDRECQGIFTKLINPSFNISPYPMPFESTLNLNLGSSNIGMVSVRIYSANTGLQVFTADYQNQSGVLQLDLSKLAKGAYGMQLIINNTKKEFKIIK